MQVLECALHALQYNWRSIDSPSVKWNSIYCIWRNWRNSNAFENAWTYVLKTYAETKLKNDPYSFQALFIDTTLIKNINGRDCVGKNPTDRGRKGSKISVICDMSEIPIAVQMYPANIGDQNTAVETVESIKCRVRRDNRYKNIIVGDKGYVSNEASKKLQEKGYTLLTPPKKNSRIQFRTKREQILLQERCRIEHVFCLMKKRTRFRLRNDVTKKSFLEMLYLSFLQRLAAKMS